jgi:hypothetical protein
MLDHNDIELPHIELSDDEMSTVTAGLKKCGLSKLTGDVATNDSRTTVSDAHDRYSN